MEALHTCQIVVLIYTQAADESEQVQCEIERAVNHKKAIVTFRIEKVTPSPGMEFHLSNKQWLDASTPPLTKHLPKLCDSVLWLLGRPAVAEAAQAHPAPVVQSTSKHVEHKPAVQPTPKQPETKPFSWSVPKQTAINPVLLEPPIIERKPDASATIPQPKPAVALPPAQRSKPSLRQRLVGRLAGLATNISASHGSIKWPRKLLIGLGALIAALVVLGLVAGMSSYAWASFFIGLTFFAGALWATVYDWFHKGSWASGAWAVLWAGGWLSISFFAVIPVIMVVGAYAGRIHMAEWIVGEEYSTGDSGWSGLHLPGFAPNPAKAEYFLSRACASGYSEGCVSLGYAYDKGLGVKQDAPTSAGFYQKACTGGNVTGCYDLGYAYESGNGVAVNFAQAASLYKLACDDGRFDACNNLGVLYERGQGVGKDPSTAVVLYKKACDNGDVHGCNNLGVLYERGGVGMDLYQAPALYKKACDNNDADGCGNLGNLIWYGNGIAQDKVKGRELLQKGCKMGSKWSCDRLKELQ